MRTPKASVLIITLLILFAASVFALLSLNSIRFLITNSDLTYQYLASKYLTKGVSELELLKSKNYVFGIEDKILSGSNTVKENINLGYQGIYWEAESTVLGSGKVCIDGGLSGIILPLFWWGNLEELPFSGGKLINLEAIDNISILATGDIVVGLVPENIDDLYLNPSKYKIEVTGSTFSNPIRLNFLEYNSNEKNFLIILIKSGEDIVCLEATSKFPLPYQTIYTFSSVGRFRVGEKIIKQLRLPGWLLYMIVGI